MKMTNWKLGFTLIELLVVIVIIGLLSTWWVTLFATQLQKARDSNRVSDLNNLKSALTQYYTEHSRFPTHNANWAPSDTLITVNSFLPWLVRDPRHDNVCGLTKCWYVFRTWHDWSNIPFWAYELSTWFENQSNVASLAANSNDRWNDANRYEIWDLRYRSSATAFAAFDTSVALTANLSWVAAMNTNPPISTRVTTKVFLNRTTAGVPVVVTAP